MNATTTTGAVMTMDAFRAQFAGKAPLFAVLGEDRGVQMLRGMDMIWDRFPAYFPELATHVIECDCIRGAAWDIQQIMSEVPGGYDVWKIMRDIAEI